MDIKDFLPKYPNIEKSRYDILNPYEDSFEESIFRKKEFYDNRLESSEELPRERGLLLRHQKTIARYISGNTPYDSLLLVHAMGTGKTCSAIGAIEQIKNEKSTINGAIIIGRGDNILDNWKNELVMKCTAGEYIPENFKNLTDLEKNRRITKKISQFYSLKTLQKFGKQIKQLTDENIINLFSNKIIVIDEIHNLRIQSDLNKKKESLETYEQYHRFLHLVQNCKILLLSGTPMKDSPEEIASVANLILPLKDQLPTGATFLSEYMESDKHGVLRLVPDKARELKEKLRGKISFLREAHSTISKEFLGEKNYGELEYLIVDPFKMSKFQSKSYEKAYKQDMKGKTGVWTESREASLFVYPDGSWGREGFKKYIKEQGEMKGIKGTSQGSSFRMTQELRKALKGETVEETLKNIAQCSTVYANVIRKILNTKGNCFIYSSLAKGSGGILFSLLLGLVGMARANGKENTKHPRYAILTNKTASAKTIRKIVKRYNKKDNMKGEYIKVVIGSKTVSEGFSFKNVVFECINTPHWNYSETAQALARGIRHGSHDDMIESGITPIVQLLQPVAIPREGKSIDLHMYETSEIKDISIRNILRLLMEISFDCSLNYFRNHVDGVDGSRECDYTVCDYKCNGVNMQAVREGLGEEELDYSTYQLFYANPKTPLIRKKIENLFRKHKNISLDAIITNLGEEFTEEEIKNALFTIEEETGSEEFDYRTFVKIYSRTPIKKIIDSIEKLFRSHFRLNLKNILEKFPDYTEYEVITALRTMINDSIIITNKYGLPSYLREDHDTFFLINNLTINATFFSEYYTKFLHIENGYTFDKILTEKYREFLPRFIKIVCRAKDEDFPKLMASLPKEVQEMFIEASITAKTNKIKSTKRIRKKIMEYFKSYIKKVDDVYVSTFLEKLRCFEEGKWDDCAENYKDIIKEKKEKQKQELKEDNKYGLIGLYNPQNDAFCIADFKKETKVRKKMVEMRETGQEDKRLMYTGRVCKTWTIKELFSMIINRLKINPPKDYAEDESFESLLTRFRQEKWLVTNVSKEEIKNVSHKQLRRIVYWGTPPNKGGARRVLTLCSAVQNFLKEKGLLIDDEQCGVQGKKKGGKTVQKSKKANFRVEQIIPEKSEARFTEIIPEIKKLMKDCFDTKDFKPEINNNTWILVFTGKKLVGFVTIDKKNILWNVCVSKTHRRQGIATYVMSLAVNKVCSKKGKNPVLIVDKKGKNGKSLIKMYKSFGFNIESEDERYTFMKHECKL